MNADNRFHLFDRLNSSLIYDLIFKNAYSYLLSFKDLNIWLMSAIKYLLIRLQIVDLFKKINWLTR